MTKAVTKEDEERKNYLVKELKKVQKLEDKIKQEISQLYQKWGIM